MRGILLHRNTPIVHLSHDHAERLCRKVAFLQWCLARYPCFSLLPLCAIVSMVKGDMKIVIIEQVLLHCKISLLPFPHLKWGAAEFVWGRTGLLCPDSQVLLLWACCLQVKNGADMSRLEHPYFLLLLRLFGTIGGFAEITLLIWGRIENGLSLWNINWMDFSLPSSNIMVTKQQTTGTLQAMASKSSFHSIQVRITVALLQLAKQASRIWG